MNLNTISLRALVVGKANKKKKEKKEKNLKAIEVWMSGTCG
jgi:hypothetical protein